MKKAAASEVHHDAPTLSDDRIEEFFRVGDSLVPEPVVVPPREIVVAEERPVVRQRNLVPLVSIVLGVAAVLCLAAGIRSQRPSKTSASVSPALAKIELPTAAPPAIAAPGEAPTVPVGECRAFLR